jgi:O-antigen ligase
VVVPVAVGGTVFAFACGSSSVHVVREIGQPVRWLALLGLLVLAAAWAAQRWEGLLLPRSVLQATCALVSVALVSALWSVDARLSVGRAVSLAALLAVAILLAQACAGRPREIQRVLLGVLGGSTAVALGGLVILAAAHRSAVEPATIGSPTRFQGLGENPDTAALLFAVTLPIAVWLILGSHDRRRRVPGAAITLLLFGSIVASGSRGALFAGGVGVLIAVLAWGGRARRTVVAGAAVAAALALGAFLETVPQKNPNAIAAPAVVTPGKPAPEPPRYANAEAAYPLDADIGRPLPGNGEPWKPRSFFGASGRGVAWTGAIDQAAGRPLVGYGFGTEGDVFVDRYYTFVGGLTENSYIGLVLQLGIVGLVLLLFLVTTLVITGWRALAGPERTLAAACLGVLCSGLAIAVVQSYLYSVGNIAAAAFWIPVFLLPAIAVSRV